MTISAEEIAIWIKRRIDQEQPLISLSPSMACDVVASLTDMKTEIEKRDVRIAALEAELAERDARISVLEVAAVKAVLPLEAMNISGVAKRFDEETTLAILDGISSVRAAIRARSKQEGK